MSAVVQSFWFGSKLPTLQVLSLRSFLAHGHRYQLYAFEPIENVPEGVEVLDAAAILPRDSVFTYQTGFGRGSPSAFSNLFRYKLLYDLGGWWVDTDVVCLKPFDFESEFVFATERDPQGVTSTASCVIKSPARAQYLRYCLDVVGSRDRATVIWGQIGPRLVDEAVDRFGLAHFRVAPDVFNPIDYDTFREIQAPGFDPNRLVTSFAVHLWNQKWKSYCLNPDYDGAPDGLYSRLRRQYLPGGQTAQGEQGALKAHVAFQEGCIEALSRARDDSQYASEIAAGENASLRQALDQARGELDALRQSFSWRVTRPLRNLADRLGSNNQPAAK